MLWKAAKIAKAVRGRAGEQSRPMGGPDAYHPGFVSGVEFVEIITESGNI